MASAITAPTYDPTTTAAALAEKYTAPRQQILDAQSKTATATEAGLTSLTSALSAFQTSLAGLASTGKTVYAQSAVFGDTGIGSATAGPTAAAGSYSFFVSKLAAASQVSYTGLSDISNPAGILKIQMNGKDAFEIDLAEANADGGKFLTMRELAAAINSASGNAGKLTASIVTTGDTTELVLTAKETGLASAISLDTDGIDQASSLAEANNDDTRNRILVKAQDAEIRVGSETGTAIIQASNTFTNIDGVKMTFTKAQASGAAPVTLTVGPDNAGTTANVQAFVDAFNKLKAALNKLTDPGDPSKGVSGGVFSHDGGVRALNNRLTALLRPGGDVSLASFGIVATREGTLELNTTRLMAQLARDPNGLDGLLGSASKTAPTGIAGSLETYLSSWSNSVDGQIKLRKEATSDLQSALVTRQATLDQQYDSAYQRYLLQFTQLQTLQSSMTTNLTLFDALFGNDKD